MELLAYWKVIRRRLLLIVVLMLIGGGASFYYSWSQAYRYEATTTLFLNPAVAKSVLGSLNIEAVQSLSNTYSEFMRTNSFTHRVAAEMGMRLTQEQISKALITKYVPDTQFFRITAVDTDPTVAMSLANTAAQVLIAENTVRQQSEQQQIEAQRTQATGLVQQRRTEVQKALEDQLAANNQQIADIQNQITEIEQGKVSPENDARLQRLRDALASLQSTRVNVLSSLLRAQSDMEASNANSASNIDTAVIVDVAPLPTVPLARGTVRNTFLGLVVCLVFGVGLAFLLDYLDDTIKSPTLLDITYKMPTLGAITNRTKRWWKRKEEIDLIVANDPTSPVAEMFRALRIGVQVAHLDTPARSLLVTSALPNEGKTYIAANLAVSLALNGSRVILVDADLRNPQLHEVFHVRPEPGLTNLLFAADDSLEAFLSRTSVENLFLLTCGTKPLRPSELLGSARVGAMMDVLSEYAEFVIFDSPPAIAITDALVLAPQVDAVIQVVAAGRTNTDLVLGCKAAIERAGGRLLGPVLNKLHRRDYGQYSQAHRHYFNSIKSSSLGSLISRATHHEHLNGAVSVAPSGKPEDEQEL